MWQSNITKDFLIHPDNKAGASERAGFIEAPDINAKKKISNPTIAPILSTQSFQILCIYHY